jgi:3-hydroxyacyl-CoA dehydrogenase
LRDGASVEEDANELPSWTTSTVEETTLTTSLSDALVDADLLIEAIPERLDIKRAFYTRLQAVAPVKTRPSRAFRRSHHR